MQQINFYHSEFRPKKEVLPAWQFLAILGFALVCLIILSIVTIIFQPDPAEKLERQQQTLLQKQQQVVQLQNKLDTNKEHPLLRAEFEHINKKLSEKQSLLDYVSSNELGNQQGFSSSLESLSEQSIENVWLTQFTFLNAGQFIALKGKTASADIVPKYIDSLGQSSTFSGKTFSVFNIQKPDGEAYFNFELFTHNSDVSN